MRLYYQLRQAHQQWRKDDGSLLAAAVAYYAALSFFPLLLVLISGFGLVLEWTAWGQNAESQLLSAIGDYASPAVEGTVRQILGQVQRKAAISGPLGIGILLFTAVALFSHFDRAFDRIWNVDRQPVEGLLHAMRRIALYRLRAFLMLVALLGLILLVFAAGVTLSSLRAYAHDYLPAVPWFWWVVQSAASLLLNWGSFTLLYRFLPKVSVRWAAATRGGLLAAVAWECGRLILNGLLISSKYSAYGIVGSFIALMLWVYFATTVVFVGAEYVQVICKNRGQKPSTDDLPGENAEVGNRATAHESGLSEPARNGLQDMAR